MPLASASAALCSWCGGGSRRCVCVCVWEGRRGRLRGKVRSLGMFTVKCQKGKGARALCYGFVWVRRCRSGGESRRGCPPTAWCLRQTTRLPLAPWSPSVRSGQRDACLKDIHKIVGVKCSQAGMSLAWPCVGVDHGLTGLYLTIRPDRGRTANKALSAADPPCPLHPGDQQREISEWTATRLTGGQAFPEASCADGRDVYGISN